jgi:hypothetical protein
MNSANSDLGNLLGIGCVRTAQGPLPYRFSYRDADVDNAWMADCLRMLGIGRGNVIHISHPYAEVAQFWPIYHGARQLGAVYANGMTTSFDAYRLEMYLRRLQVTAVIGTTVQTLEGLQQGGHDLAKVFSRAKMRIALPDAAARLRELGLETGNLIKMGPFIAIEAVPGEGARFNNREWHVESIDGELHVTSAQPRAGQFQQLATGVKGHAEKVKTPLGPEWRIFAQS